MIAKYRGGAFQGDEVERDLGIEQIVEGSIQRCDLKVIRYVRVRLDQRRKSCSQFHVFDSKTFISSVTFLSELTGKLWYIAKELPPSALAGTEKSKRLPRHAVGTSQTRIVCSACLLSSVLGSAATW